MLRSLNEKKGFAVQASRGTQAKSKMRLHATLGNSQQKSAVPLILYHSRHIYNLLFWFAFSLSSGQERFCSQQYCEYLKKIIVALLEKWFWV